MPDEYDQFQAYAALLQRLRGKPFIIRTLDVGGDKALPGVSLQAETNPFLGLRGLRLCLDRPELFRPQVRALLRAAVFGPLKVMLPMVATADELREAEDVFATCLAELRPRTSRPGCRRSASWSRRRRRPRLDLFAGAAFFSIGSNDLTQYAMAASRDGRGRVAALNDPLHPAVLRLIGRVVEHGRASGAGQPVRRHGVRSRARSARCSSAGLRRCRSRPRPSAGSSRRCRAMAQAMAEPPGR